MSIASERVGTVKATGIVRQLDELGRIVLPIELRRTLGIHEKDPLEIFVDGEKVLLRKYEPSCTFCGEANDTIAFRGKVICSTCLNEMQSIVTPV